MDKTGHTPKEYIGKICPYCKTAFVEGDEIVQCSACEMPHHKDCWIENQGCTTFGCQGTIRGLDGQAYSQMMAEGAQKAQQASQAYQRPVYGQNGYAFAGQSQQAERPVFGAQPAAYGSAAAQGAGKACPNCGAQNIGDSIFCARCGARMAQADAPAGQAVAGQSASAQAVSGQSPAEQAFDAQASAQGAAAQNQAASQAGQAPAQTFAGQPGAQPASAASSFGAPAPAQTQAPGPAEQLCPACGARNPAGSAFCYACGKRLAEQARPAQARETFCQVCGAKNPAEAVFCYGCGAKLYRPGQQEQPGPDAAHPYDAIRKQGQPKADAAHPYDAIRKQGSRANPAAGAGAAGQAAPADAAGPVCPECGTKNAAQAVFCQECGARLSGQVDPAHPYDAIKKQGSKRPAGASPYASSGQGAYQPAGQTQAAPSASAQPYGQSAYRPANPAAAQGGGQPYGAYGAAPRGQAAPVYTPPLGTYRVPSYTIPQPSNAAPPTPEELAEERRLFLGKNEVYYEKKFAQLQGGQLTWNWAAACLTSFWFIYRRMYLWGYLSLLGQVILAAILGYAWPVAPLLACILFGMFGNRIYMGHVEKEMKLVRRLSKQNRLIEYADKGGVRLAHPVIAGTIIGAYLIALLCSLYI